ncbi:TPA: hypothetical protein ACH3X2_007903 [Trebouxia sp. C0005]
MHLQERTQALEAELAQSSAQLQQLQALQTSLRTKNQLLEKLLHLNKQADFKASPELPQRSVTVLDLYKQRGFKTVPEPMLAVMQTLPALRLTIWDGGEEMIPVQDVGKLGLQEVAKLYTAYVHQMAACLAQLTDTLPTEQSSSPAMQRLSELVTECGSLIVITLISNPKGFKDLQNCNMDERIVCPDAQPPSFYCEVMAAMQHTGSQTQDWLHLRQLFYFKIGQLARERKALVMNMTQCQMDMGHVSDKLTQMTRWADQLRENGAEEYRSYCMFATAFLRGISTSKQIATGHVCAFPWIPTVYKLLEAEAVRRGHPPMQTYIEDTSVDDLHHAANFTAVASYLETITLESLEVHVPFWSDSR